MKSTQQESRGTRGRGRSRFLSATLLTLAMGCGGSEPLAAEAEDVTPPSPQQAALEGEPCLTVLHEDTEFSQALQADPDALPPEQLASRLACLREGTFTREDLRKLGFVAPAVGSIDVSNGYRATLRFADGSAAVYTGSRGALPTPATAEAFQSVTVEWCPASIALEGQPDAEAHCLGLGENALLAVGAAGPRELRVAPGYEVELPGADGQRYFADKTVSDAQRLSALGLSTGQARAVVSHVDDAGAGASRRMSLSSQDVQAQLLPTGWALGDLRRVVILGDSLSDQHNMRAQWVHIPYPYWGYWEGRFTNGYNWVDYMVRDYPVLSTKVINKAVGGAEARVHHVLRPSVKEQASRYVEELRRTGQLGTLATTLFVIWGGANDTLNNANSTFFNPSNPTPETFATQTNQALTEARAILTATGYNPPTLFVDLPDISTVPTARISKWSAQKSAWVKDATARFNSKLAGKKAQARVDVLAVNAFIQRWMNGTYRSGFMNDFTTACHPYSAMWPAPFLHYNDRPCQRDMFFDVVHPTTLAHCGIAGEVADILATGFNTRRVGDRAARISDCAQRRQNSERAFWRDTVVAPITTFNPANVVCPAACTRLGSTLDERMRWNGQWTNTPSAYALCGCISEPKQPVPLWRDVRTPTFIANQAAAELTCPKTCAAEASLLTRGMFWNRQWTNANANPRCGCTSRP